MRRLLALAGALFALGLSITLASGQVGFNGMFPGPGSPAGAAATCVSSGYQGPGNIKGSAAWYIGGRAYTAADCGNKLFNVCNAGDVTCVDMSSSTSTGYLVVVSVGGTDCTASATTCTVKTAYDRSGNAINFTEATAANRPTLNTNAANGHACLQFLGSSSQRLVGTSTDIAIPWTISAVAKRTSTTTENDVVGGYAGNGVTFGFNNSANTLFTYAGLAATLAGTDNTFQAIQAVDLSSNLDLFANGTSSGNVGSNNHAIQQTNISIGDNENGTPANFLTGIVCEASAYSTNFSGTDVSNMQTNQRSATSGWNF